MPESVSGVDAILDGLRERATGWSCVPLADAVAAVHAAAGLGSPDERLREALCAYRSALRSGERESAQLRALGDAALAAADREAPDEEEVR